VLACNNGQGSALAGDAGRVTSLDIWWNNKSLAGLHIHECDKLHKEEEAAGAAA
jgi:hypothetical protein